MDTNAEPPAPNIKPRHATIMISGNIKLTPAKALVLTKLEIKKPSTTQYIDVKTIIKIGDNVNLSIFLNVK
jgi:hypothetical protein